MGNIYIPLFLDLYQILKFKLHSSVSIYIPLFLDLYNGLISFFFFLFLYLHSTIFRFVQIVLRCGHVSKPYLHSTIFRFVHRRTGKAYTPDQDLHSTIFRIVPIRLAISSSSEYHLHSTIFRFVHIIARSNRITTSIYIPLFLDLYLTRLFSPDRGSLIYIPLFLDLYLTVNQNSLIPDPFTFHYF